MPFASWYPCYQNDPDRLSFYDILTFPDNSIQYLPCSFDTIYYYQGLTGRLLSSIHVSLIGQLLYNDTKVSTK